MKKRIAALLMAAVFSVSTLNLSAASAEQVTEQNVETTAQEEPEMAEVTEGVKEEPAAEPEAEQPEEISEAETVSEEEKQETVAAEESVEEPTAAEEVSEVISDTEEETEAVEAADAKGETAEEETISEEKTEVEEESSVTDVFDSEEKASDAEISDVEETTDPVNELNPEKMTMLLEEEESEVQTFEAGPAFAEMTIDGTTKQYSDTTEFFENFQAASDKTITIKLLKDVTITNSHIPVGENQTVTLDFNGHKLIKEDNSSYAPIENYGYMTLTDTSDDKNGGISGENRCVNNYNQMLIQAGRFTTTNNYGGTAVQNKIPEAEMTIEDCTVEAGVFAFYNAGTATIKGGSFSNQSCSACNPDGWAYTMKSEGNLHFIDGNVTGIQGALAVVAGEAIIDGGTFTTNACKKHGAGNAFYALYVAGENDSVKAIVNDGTFTSHGKFAAVLIGNDNTNGDGGINAAASSEIRGGTFTVTEPGAVALKGAPNTGNPVVSGGKFSTPIDKKYCAENYIPTGVQPDGSYTVTIESAVQIVETNQ